MNAETFARFTIEETKVVVCVGCGGVGKTTVSAALAVEAARRGRRVLVLTIDPARRLADALGVQALGNQPQELPRSAMAVLDIPERGSLSALMLDMKRTFDDIVERFADTPESRDRILSNSIYQHVSDAMSGSIEYSAMEKVLELHESEEFDLIVVDTPPAQHALDFLEAPQRLLEFLDSKLVAMFIHPAFSAGRFGFRVFQGGVTRVFNLLERLTGVGLLEDISELLLAFEGMTDGFRERARAVRSLLTGPNAAFVLVTGPGWESVTQANLFLERLEAYEVPLRGVLVNRLHLWPGDATAPRFLSRDDDWGEEGSRQNEELKNEEDEALEALTRVLAESGADGFPAHDAARAALDTARGYAAWVWRDEEATRDLRARTERSGRYWGSIPELADDVHDLAGLGRIADFIFVS